MKQKFVLFQLTSDQIVLFQFYFSASQVWNKTGKQF